MNSHDPNTSVAYCAKEAMRTLTRHAATPRMVLATIIAAAPLYLVGYDQGAYPVLGLVAAFTIGALTMALCGALARAPALDALLASTVVRSVAVRGLLISVALTACVLLALAVLRMLLAAPPPFDPGFLDNTYRGWWKPIAHVAAGAAMYFGVVPYAVVSVPLERASGMPTTLARHCAYRYAHGRAYRPVSLLAAAYLLATVAFVPVLGILVPGACAFMGVRYYRMAFEE